ncbi:MAG TPA: hypothetical protein DET40_08780 [Lentisphaeria bacterium]|nr:MAG: hypothetical protein A2X45_19455 [Lentisphaerae bacterium GWF2_50_93]HCE43629.1 hypothetical protein [Lentisphaeria bacterium]
MFVSVLDPCFKIEMVVDDRIKSKAVAIHFEHKKILKKEAWNLFVNVLWNAGAYCTLKDKTVYILPVEKK